MVVDGSMSSGVYRIRNLVSGKVYVGSTVNIKKRWATHLHRLRAGAHQNAHLQSSWDKHGEDVFAFEIIEEVPPDALLETEQRCLDVITKNLRYNIIEEVSDGVREYWKGDSARERQSAKLRAHWADQDYRERQSKARRGMYDEPGFKAKQSKSSTARWKSAEFRAKFKTSIDAPGRKESRSEKARACWADPEIRAKRIAGIKANWKERHRAAGRKRRAQ
jgi:group I intron endonuclease